MKRTFLAAVVLSALGALAACDKTNDAADTTGTGATTESTTNGTTTPQ